MQKTLIYFCVIVLSGILDRESAQDTVYCKLKHFDMEIYEDSIYLRWNISECQERIDNTTVFNIHICEESNDSCVCSDKSCYGECDEMKLNLSFCGNMCVIDMDVTISDTVNLQPPPCIRLEPDAYVTNSAKYPDSGSNGIKLTQLACTDDGHSPSHLLVFNGGEFKRNKDDHDASIQRGFCQPMNLNESNSVAIVEYCESSINKNEVSACEEVLNCRSKPIPLIIPKSRIVVCSEYSAGRMNENLCVSIPTSTTINLPNLTTQSTSTDNGHNNIIIVAAVSAAVSVLVILAIIIIIIVTSINCYKKHSCRSVKLKVNKQCQDSPKSTQIQETDNL